MVLGRNAPGAGMAAISQRFQKPTGVANLPKLLALSEEEFIDHMKLAGASDHMIQKELEVFLGMKEEKEKSKMSIAQKYRNLSTRELIDPSLKEYAEAGKRRKTKEIEDEESYYEEEEA